jgi:hypothetical protein
MAKKKKPRRKKPVDPFLILVNATGFREAMCDLDRPLLLFYYWPSIMCGAFSLELYLKCLHRIRRRNAHGHDPKRLFGQLTKADRKRIASLFDKYAPEAEQYANVVAHGIKMDLDSVLTRVSNMFERSRYWHEGDLPEPDSNGICGAPGLDVLIDTVKDVILEIRPEWVERADKLVETIPPGNLRIATSPSHHRPMWHVE